MLGFEKANGAQALAYWKAVDLMTETFEGTITLELPEEERPIHLIDLLSGDIYEIPENMITRNGNGVISLDHLPLTDLPVLLTFGDFLE